jgi:hypothetical protein
MKETLRKLCQKNGFRKHILKPTYITFPNKQKSIIYNSRYSISKKSKIFTDNQRKKIPSCIMKNNIPYHILAITSLTFILLKIL